MSTKVNGQFVMTLPEFTVLAYLVATALLPVLEIASIYEAGRQAGQATPKPLWEPF